MFETLKTTVPGHHFPPIELKPLKEIELCVVAYLKKYILMTAPLQKYWYKAIYIELYITTQANLISNSFRWCVIAMKKSGINVNIFGPYLTMSVSTPKC